MPRLRLCLLGTVRVIVEDRRLSFPPGPVAALVGYLGLFAGEGRALSRSRVAGTLWPDQPEARARRYLADTLYRLRRALGDQVDPAWIAADDETLSLVDVSTDAADFRTRAAAFSPDDLQAAVALYTGDLLEEVDAEWALGPRAELRELYLASLERLYRSLLGSGQLPDALTYAHRWSRADPLSEEACRAAMALYARLGRHAAALQHFNLFARVLDDELQIAPLPETRALADSIRAEADELLSGPAGAPARRRLFVGRRRERSLLLTLLEEVQAGRGGAAFVEGEPGAGKTRLLETLAEGAQWRGLTVVWGRARALAGATPFAPLDEALQASLVGPRLDHVGKALSPDAAEALSGLVPRLKPARSAGPHDPSDLPSAAAEAVWALADLSPHVFIFDDVQWAEDEFWDVLLKIAPGLISRRLAVIVSYRSEEARSDSGVWRALRELERDLVPLKLVLSGLSASECAELGRGLGRAIEPEDVEQVRQRTGGNPLYVQEIILGSSLTPDSLQALMETRLARLPGAALSAIQSGAVLGREFGHGAWQAMVGQELLEHIPLLIGARFVEESETGYLFQHDVTRDYVYRTMDPDRRRGLHYRAGEILQREGVGPAGLAWHFEQAEAWPEAVRFHREAGIRADRIYANRAALVHYERALDLIERLGGFERERLDLLRRRLNLLIEAGRRADWQQAAEYLERAASEAGDAPALLVALECFVNLYATRADWEGMKTSAHRGIQIALASGEVEAEQRLQMVLGYYLSTVIGQSADAIPHLERAIQLAEPGAGTNAEPLATALNALAIAQRLDGKCAAAQETLRRVLTMARPQPGQGVPPDLIQSGITALQVLAQTQADLGHWQAAHTTIREALEARVDNEPLWDDVRGLRAAMQIAAGMGQLAEAGQAARRLLALPIVLSLPEASLERCHILANVVALHLAAGELDDAGRMAGPMAQWVAAQPAGRGLLNIWTTLGALYLAQGRPAEALEPLAQASALWRQTKNVQDVEAVLLYALAAQRAGQPALAQAMQQLARASLDDSDIVRFTVLQRFVGFELSGSSGDLEAARAEIRRQADLIDDPRLRADFLDSVALHREVELRWQALQSAAGSIARVRLARADAPLGVALTDAHRIDVQWTVDAGPADAAVLQREGKVALRHHRLNRLIAEARAQGAAPTDSDLARALGVDVRTIGRDMARIRARGGAAPTRRRRS